jgi:hypothetical protein
MDTRSRGGLGRCRIRTGPRCRGCRVPSANTAAPRAHPLAPVWIASYAGRRVTDINVFVRLSRRNAEREAVGLARMRQQVKAGKLKVAWMSEEEKAAYRLQEAPEAGATVASDPGEYEPGEVDRALASPCEGCGGPVGQREGRGRPSIPLHRVAWRAPIVQGYHVGCDAVAGATLGMVWLATRTRALGYAWRSGGDERGVTRPSAHRLARPGSD